MDALARRLEQAEQECRSLREENQALQEKSKRDDAKIERIERENQELRRRLDKFIRIYFGGTKNEGISPNQLELALLGLPATLSEKPAPTVPVNQPARPARARVPARRWMTSASNNARR